jgi:DNA-binding MarR family transcriptional regulator
VNKLVQLVNLWAEFEAKNPNGEIRDFCSDYIVNQYKEKPLGEISLNAQLAAHTGKLAKYAGFYSKKALEKFSLNNIEDWVYLMRLREMGSPKKSELIYEMISEFPSGIDVINRLIKMEFVQEFQDVDDKRSKRIQITPLGIEILVKSLPWMEKIATMAFSKLDELDKIVLLEHLEHLSTFHKTHHMNVRGLSIEEAYEVLVK